MGKLERLEKVYLPGTMWSESGNVYLTNGDSIHGFAPSRYPLITAGQLKLLHEMGLYTINDLVEAQMETIVTLRGWGRPDDDTRGAGEEAHPIQSIQSLWTDAWGSSDYICDLRELAMAVVNKCSLDPRMTWRDGKEFWPRNIDPAYPEQPEKVYAQWYGKDYTAEAEQEDPFELLDNWDGCTMFSEDFLANSENMEYNNLCEDSVNVDQLGCVPLVSSIRNPWLELQELHCKWNPGGRVNHAGTYFDGRFYVMGGRSGNDELKQDMWYRDDRLPKTFITQSPESQTYEDIFKVYSDEEGCFQEYRLYSMSEDVEVRRWNRFNYKITVKYLDHYNQKGPGTGRYIIYFRSSDPAGNRDPTYMQPRNMLKWTYVTREPVGLIVGCVLGFFGALLVIYAEIRRRARNAAMKRYAIKRMRRKFKAQQKESSGKANWREMGEGEDGGDGKEKKKKKKKKGDKDKDGKKGSGKGKKAGAGKVKDKDKGGKSKDKDKKAKDKDKKDGKAKEKDKKKKDKKKNK